jgi:hypothetical protein
MAFGYAFGAAIDSLEVSPSSLDRAMTAREFTDIEQVLFIGLLRTILLVDLVLSGQPREFVDQISRYTIISSIKFLSNNGT